MVARAHTRKLDFRHGRVEMNHGSGGKAMAQLIEELFLAAFDNPLLRPLEDQARFEVAGGRMVMACDSHVVSPLFFPGGDIGSLSVHGTINDVAMSGARPLYLAAGFILEEGFPLGELRRIVESMARAAREANVAVVTGDTKVVEAGKGDGVFITTTGVGMIPEGIQVGSQPRPGDKVLLSGFLGDHGVAILSLREGLSFDTTIESDSAALHGLVASMVAAVPAIRCLHDPTRGGLAATLNEITRRHEGIGIRLEEGAIPIREPVRAACEFLGLDPLYSANEGKLVAICKASSADTLLAAMRSHPLGREAAIIGEVVEDVHGFVEMRTVFGGSRVVDWLSGEQLPRIC